MERRKQFEELSLVHFEFTGTLGRFKDQFSGCRQPPVWRCGPGLSSVLGSMTLLRSRVLADIIGVDRS